MHHPNDDYNPLLAAAIGYEASGLSVIPLQGKRPRVKWEQYQSERATPTQIMAWWDEWPDANVGIVTGQIGGIIVLDIDGDDGRRVLRCLPAFATAAVSTGKGEHHYFAYNGPSRNFVRKLPGLDLRGDGGYVVAPPSIHPSGVIYEWVNDLDVMPAPAWLVELMNAERAPARTRSESGARKPGTAYAEAALRSEADRVRSATQGQRNHTLNVAAFALGQLVAAGALDEDRVFAELDGAAASNGLPAGERRRTIESGLSKGMQQPREVR